MNKCNYIFFNEMAISMPINSDGRSDPANPSYAPGGGGARMCSPMLAPGDEAGPEDVHVVVAVAA
jgi:hypothetical protein